MQKTTKLKVVLSVLFLNLLIYSCKGDAQQLHCYNDFLTTKEQSSIFINVKKSLFDTLNSWMDRKLLGVRSISRKEWRIDDAVFFNETLDMAVLLILERDTQQIVNFGSKENPEFKKPSQDNIKMILGDFKNNRWEFYYYSMPDMVVPRSLLNKTEALTFEELSKIGRVDVLSNYYKTGSCEINMEYFKYWKIDMLKEKHNLFLTSDKSIYGYMYDN